MILRSLLQQDEDANGGKVLTSISKTCSRASQAFVNAHLGNLVAMILANSLKSLK
jgi:hypothetical protein